MNGKGSVAVNVIEMYDPYVKGNVKKEYCDHIIWVVCLQLNGRRDKCVLKVFARGAKSKVKGQGLLFRLFVREVCYVKERIPFFWV